MDADFWWRNLNEAGRLKGPGLDGTVILSIQGRGLD
jgi:hypothetical protein